MTSQDKVTVAELVDLFRLRLEGIYPPEEVEALLARTFENHLQMNRAELMIHADRQLHWFMRHIFEGVIRALERYEPIQYVLGRAEFYGLDLWVDERVLIPRPETEELVRWIIDETESKPCRILDIGTGSGCIAIALKKHLPKADVHALDRGAKQLDVAVDNARTNKVDVRFFQHDILERDSLNFMHFDVMVSNPPYIVESEKDDMDANVRDHEPHEALFVPDREPLLFYRRIVDLAEGHLHTGGRLYFEVHRDHGLEVAGLLQDRGYRDVELRRDLDGNERMVRGVKS